MVRHSMNGKSQSTHVTGLLNFHFSTPHPSQNLDQQQQSTNRRYNDHHGGNNRRRINNNNNNSSRNFNKQQHKKSTSELKKRNSQMFYLHSSRDHAFIITRRSNTAGTSKNLIPQQQSYSFEGPDSPVSWESVRMVKQLVSSVAIDTTYCPICLDSFSCPRITKCGHSFCLPCILHHFQSYAAQNPYQHVKCPCCAVPFHMSELRPVCMESTAPLPLVHRSFTFRKLHRSKDCPAPYLPYPNHPRHASPYTAPCMTDDDARYCRFNYVDPVPYHSHLKCNQLELEKSIQMLTQSKSGATSSDLAFLTMALDVVMKEQHAAQEELDEELELKNRFEAPNAGMYQPQSQKLVYQDGYSLVRRECGEGTCGERDGTIEDSLANSASIRRFHGDSIGSQVSFESVSSSASCGQPNAVGGALSPQVSSPNPSSSERRSKRILSATPKVDGGSMYLDANSVQFYQAEDGQLVFMNGFNMACLLADFSKTNPFASGDEPSLVGQKEHLQQQQQQYQQTADQFTGGLQWPLPDTVKGNVLEVETIHLTSDVRKRMPFLSHVPLYTDVIFVELELSHILSDATKQRFKSDIIKRKKKRQSKVQAEKRADREAKQKEEDRIQNLKDRMQRIDPNDEFFHPSFSPPSSQSFLEGPPLAMGDEFGPTIGSVRSNVTTVSHTQSVDAQVGLSSPVRSVPQHTTTTAPANVSFSQACQRRVAPPSFAEAFPALGRSPPAPKPLPPKAASTWGGNQDKTSPPEIPPSLPQKPAVSNPETYTSHAKKKKGKKIVLLSTGGQRGPTF